MLVLETNSMTEFMQYNTIDFMLARHAVVRSPQIQTFLGLTCVDDAILSNRRPITRKRIANADMTESAIANPRIVAIAEVHLILAPMFPIGMQRLPILGSQTLASTKETNANRADIPYLGSGNKGSLDLSPLDHLLEVAFSNASPEMRRDMCSKGELRPRHLGWGRWRKHQRFGQSMELPQ